jgi:YtcA family
MARRSLASELATRSQLRGTFLFLAFTCFGGCSADGAPSFDLFGAFFPAWLLCGIVGVAGAVAARVAFVSGRVANALPYQLAVCVAIGVITAVLFWLVGFGH